MQAEAFDLPAGRVDLVEQGAHVGRRAVGGDAERQSPGGVVDGPAGEPQVGLLAGEGQVQAVTAGAGLQALEGSGLGESDKTSVALLVSSFVRSQALLMADLAAAVAARGVPPEEVNASYERTLKRLVDPARHPGISRLLESGAMSGPDDPDYEFTFGLERLLDGVEALIRKTDGGSRVPADGVNSV